jgi:para-nitrobenzyl esterase
MAMPAATGLFHRAIAMSGSAIKGVSRADATKSAEALLTTLGLKTTQVDQLQKLPIERLIEAIRATRGLRLSPVVDGRTLPTDPFDPVAPSVSAHVPMMMSSTATEVTFQGNTPLDPIDNATLVGHVKDALGASDADANKVIAVYRKAQPNLSNIDLYHILASDNAQRFNATIQAERKAALRKAPSYLYYFATTTPVRSGKLKSPHCLDIAYAFDNVDRAVELTGGKDPAGIAAKLSGAFAAFARTGNPSHSGIPNWAPYNAVERATMVFDNTGAKLANDPNREERLALLSIRGSRTE